MGGMLYGEFQLDIFFPSLIFYDFILFHRILSKLHQRAAISNTHGIFKNEKLSWHE